MAQRLEKELEVSLSGPHLTLEILSLTRVIDSYTKCRARGVG